MTSTRILGIVIVLAASPSALADRITLRGGGQIHGVVLPHPDKAGSVLIQTEASAHPLTFEKSAILAVDPENGPLKEYVTQRGTMPDTAQAHYDLGLWCEEAHLRGPAEVEFARSVALDPEFGPAHKKLGHVQHGDRWLTYEQQREAQGLIKYKGRWISRAEKGKIDAAAATAAEQSSWASRLKILRRKLHDDDPTIRADAESQISAIRDPAAIPGLIRAFSGDGDAVRVRMAQLIGAIPGPEATEALVTLTVTEAVDEVRQAVLDEVARRRDPDAPIQLIAALKARDPLIIARAAWALAGLKYAPAVPKLVDALLFSEKRVVLMQVASPAPGGFSGSVSFGQQVSGGVGGVGGFSNFGGGSSVSGSSGFGGGAPGGFSNVASQGYLTGAAVGPGVVAYGASSYPIPANGTSAPIGGGVQVNEIPARVKVNHPNPEVLRALQTLTNVDYGYDQAAWKKWITTSFRIEPDAPRRVPRP